MIIRKIALNGFRNYEFETVEFAPGTNVISGQNAQGKTNLLEAVYMLSCGRSFRTRFDRELVGFGYSGADILADVYSHEREQTINIQLRPGQGKKILVNDVKKTAGELADTVNTVLFCPDDLQILKAGSAGRRKLLDTALCQLRPGYAAALAEYRKLYDSKSRILKDYHEQPSLLDPLPEFNYRMAQVGAILISSRARYLRELGAAAGDYHREFSGGREGLMLRYQTVSTIDDPFADRRVLFQQILSHQEAHYRAELDSGQCLTGPHKDDFDAALDGLSIKAYGSQGQTRTAAISLKLAERELFRRDTGEEPVLLLDDVLSELDGTRQDFVLNQIRTGQVLITCCEPEKLTGLGQTVQIHGGQVMLDVS